MTSLQQNSRSDQPNTPTVSADFSGLRCPHLLIAVIAYLRQLSAETIVTIIANDLNAPSSIGAWLRQSGNSLLDLSEQDGQFRFVIRCDTPPVRDRSAKTTQRTLHDANAH